MSLVTWHADKRLWWPTWDETQKNYRFLMKHAPDSDFAVGLCKRRRTAVQAGSHVGVWPLRLAKRFQRVFTFEVQPALQEACRLNCLDAVNVICCELGLGATETMAPLLPTWNHLGGWRIDPEGDLETQLVALDDFCLADVDLIVLDIEGYEVEALKGAADTLRRCRPVLHVEELQKNEGRTARYIQSLGYRPVRRIAKDVVYVKA